MATRQKRAAAIGALGAFTAVFTAGAAAGPLVKALPEAPETRALETVSRGVSALAFVGGRLLMLAADRPLVVSVPFAAAGATREAVFGKLVDQRRESLGPPGEGAAWSGIDAVEDRLLFLDGRALAWLEVEPQTFKVLATRTLPWDLLKPPRDRGGEPTGPEIAALRAAFKKAYLATAGQRIAGMAPLPDAWHAGGARQYLLATRVPGYPLLLMECERDDPTACMVARQCYLGDGAGAGLTADAITGLAVSEARRMVYIGDAAARQIVGFKYHSCYHVPRREALTLPAKLKRLAGLMIDGDDRLWVSTETPDDYLNASVFAWDAKDW